LELKNHRECAQCVYFEPNSAYPLLGYCRINNEASLGIIEACGSFRRASVDELKKELEKNGWLFCVTCGRVLSSEEELAQHLGKHLVSSKIIIDDGVAEEAYSAD